MAKIRNISVNHFTLGFIEFDVLEKCKNTLKTKYFSYYMFSKCSFSDFKVGGYQGWRSIRPFAGGSPYNPLCSFI